MVKDEDAKDIISDELGIELGKEEQDSFDDNCVPDEAAKCPRKRWVCRLDKVWLNELEEDQDLEDWRE